MTKIDKIFEQAVKLSDSQRAEFLQSLPGDQRTAVGKMLAAEASLQQHEKFLRPAGDAGVAQDATFISNADHSVHEKTFLSGSKSATKEGTVGDHLRYFGEYELVEEIARGGMGVVFKARQVGLNRIVALKMILSGNLAGDEEVSRFKTEAEAAAKLDHVGIVPIYEIGEHDGQHYFSMAFIDGESLQDRIRSGPLETRSAAELCAKIATAIAYAHERGVIHRDMKPANVLLDKDSQPKITDFGLAKQVQGDSNLTQTGTVMGTPGYMPPEQAAGNSTEVGPLADVYSLGAILYCLMTGRPPFQAANALDTLMQVVEKAPLSPRDLNPSVPRDLETITLKCLEKTTERRYQSADELASELNRFLRGEPIVARPVSSVERAWRWAKRHRAMAALMAMIIGVAVVAPWVAIRQGQLKKDANDRRAEAESLATSNKLLAEKNAEIAERESEQRREADKHRNIADEKRLVAEILAEQNRRQLVASQLAQADQLLEDDDPGAALPHLIQTLRLDENDKDQTRLHRTRVSATWGRIPKFTQFWRHQATVNHIALNSEETQVATTSHNGAVQIRHIDTGKLTVPVLTHRLPVWGSAFSADGRRLATVSGTGLSGELRVWDLKTGMEVGTATPGLSQQFNVFWTPQGKIGTIAITMTGTGTLTVYDAETRKATATLAFPIYGDGPLLSEDRLRAESGRFVQLRGSEMKTSTIRILELDNELNVLAEFDHSAEVVHAVLSPDGGKVFVATNGQVTIWDVETKQKIAESSADPLQAIDGLNRFMQVAFSFDERRVIAALQDNRSFTFDLSGKVTRLDTLPIDGTRSRFAAPNGRWMAFEDRIGTIRIRDIEGQRAVASPLRHTSSVKSLKFTSDSRRMITACTDGTVRIWNLAATTEVKHRRFTHNIAPVLRAELSADESELTSAGYGWARLLDIEKKSSTTTSFSRDLVDYHINSNSDFAAFSTNSKIARVINRRTGKMFEPIIHDFPYVHSVHLSTDDKLLATLAAPGNTGAQKGMSDGFLYKVETGERIAGPLSFGQKKFGVLANLFSSVTPKIAGIGAIRISPDGQLLAYCGGKLRVTDGKLVPQLRIMNISTLQEEELKHSDEGMGLLFLMSLDFSSSGRLLLSIGRDPMNDENGQLRVWDVEKKKTVLGPLQFAGVINSAAFSKDERFIAVAADRVVYVFATESGKRVCPPLTHPDPVKTISLASDDKLIATATDVPGGRNVRIWDLTSGRTLAPPIPHAFNVNGVTMLSDQRVMVCSHFEVKIWEYSPAETESINDIEQASRLLTGLEFTADGVSHCSPDKLDADWKAVTEKYPARMAAVDSQVAAWYTQVLTQFHNERDWSAATFHREHHMRRLPDDSFIWGLQGNAYSNNGQYAKALPLYVRSHQAKPEDEWRIYSLSCAALAAGDTAAVNKWTNEFIKRHKDTESVNAAGNLAKVLLLSKSDQPDPDFATRLIARSLESDPGNMWTHIAKALNELRQEKHQGCETTCAKIIDGSSDLRQKALAHAIRGLSRKQNDKPEDADKDFATARDFRVAANHRNTSWHEESHLDLLFSEAADVETQ